MKIKYKNIAIVFSCVSGIYFLHMISASKRQYAVDSSKVIHNGSNKDKNNVVLNMGIAGGVIASGLFIAKTITRINLKQNVQRLHNMTQLVNLEEKYHFSQYKLFKDEIQDVLHDINNNDTMKALTKFKKMLHNSDNKKIVAKIQDDAIVAYMSMIEFVGEDKYKKLYDVLKNFNKKELSSESDLFDENKSSKKSNVDDANYNNNFFKNIHNDIDRLQKEYEKKARILLKQAHNIINSKSLQEEITQEQEKLIQLNINAETKGVYNHKVFARLITLNENSEYMQLKAEYDKKQLQKNKHEVYESKFVENE